VRAGGTLIVQYQQHEFVRENLPPFPAKMEAVINGTQRISNVRVTDENAPVKILVPAHPVFNYPEQNHGERLGKLDSGAASLQFVDARRAIHAAARIARRRRTGNQRRHGLRENRKRKLRLQFVFLFPPASDGQSRRVPAFCEYAELAESPVK
jgi:hypothetical protein